MAQLGPADNGRCPDLIARIRIIKYTEGPKDLLYFPKKVTKQALVLR